MGYRLSQRGDDDDATSNYVRLTIGFLGYLGASLHAFSAKTHRSTPLMDGLDFHPYPVPQSLPFATGYANAAARRWSTSRASIAFYAGFNGTTQRTIGQQHGGGCR